MFLTLADHTPPLSVIGPIGPRLGSVPKLKVLFEIVVVADTFRTLEMVSYSATVMVTGGLGSTVIGAVRETPLYVAVM
jgi:hypothetical protein